MQQLIKCVCNARRKAEVMSDTRYRDFYRGHKTLFMILKLNLTLKFLWLSHSSHYCQYRSDLWAIMNLSFNLPKNKGRFLYFEQLGHLNQPNSFIKITLFLQSYNTALKLYFPELFYSCKKKRVSFTVEFCVDRIPIDY